MLLEALLQAVDPGTATVGGKQAHCTIAKCVVSQCKLGCCLAEG